MITIGLTLLSAGPSWGAPAAKVLVDKQAGPTGGMEPSGAPTGPGQDGRDATQREIVELTGVLSIVRNGTTVYYLFTTDGQPHDLMMDDDVLARAGGPLVVDRQVVTVRGRAAADSDGSIRVESIRLGGP